MTYQAALAEQRNSERGKRQLSIEMLFWRVKADLSYKARFLLIPENSVCEDNSNQANCVLQEKTCQAGWEW